ncbi:uncharacterized protein V6R79_003327 [Siganus canaliculatus]
MAPVVVQGRPAAFSCFLTASLVIISSTSKEKRVEEWLSILRISAAAFLSADITLIGVPAGQRANEAPRRSEAADSVPKHEANKHEPVSWTLTMEEVKTSSV